MYWGRSSDSSARTFDQAPSAPTSRSVITISPSVKVS